MSIIPPIFYLLEERRQASSEKMLDRKTHGRMPDPRDKMILGLFGDLEKNGHNAEPQIEVF
jgi:hypothetical protein